MVEILQPHPISRRDILRLAGGAAVLSQEGKFRWIPELLAPVTPPPIIRTGFAPFFQGEDRNPSTTIVEFLQFRYRNSENPTSEMYFLPNLPVNSADPSSAARQIKEFAYKNCPKGCIVISLGEDPNLFKRNVAARIEHQSKSSPDVPADFPTNLLPMWQLSDTLYRRIMKYIEDNRKIIFAPNPNLTVELPFGENTAGGGICEETLTSLNEFSYNQARAFDPYPILPIGIHVPNFDKNQFSESTINIIDAVAKVAVLHFEEYSRNPTFVTRSVA
jgi:hypothetical protein